MIQSLSHKPDQEFWNSLFRADSIAVIGARDVIGTWGFDALRSAFAARQAKPQRRIYAVNPSVKNIMGEPCYPSILDTPGTVELAIIVVPSMAVPGVMSQCVLKGVKAAVIISAGFAEVDEAGAKLQAETLETAHRGNIHFVGPNCIGHADMHSQVASAAMAGRVSPGSMALLTQSGTLGATIMQIANASGIGLSKLVSTGNEADLHLEDYLEYLAGDAETHIITAYIEGLREGRRFFDLTREITLKKPVVVIKTGSTGESGRAAKSHTGAMAGSDVIYSAAFRQAGVIRAEDEEELCDVALAILNQPLPKGRRVGILTMGGGFGVVTSEALEKEGLQIGALENSTIEKLNTLLPSRWSHGNPVDLVGMKMMGEETTLATCHEYLLADHNIDAVISLLPPMMPPPGPGVSFTPEQVRALQAQNQKQMDTLVRLAKQYDKPLYLIKRFLPQPGGPPATVPAANSERIPEFPHQHRVARVLRHLVWYREYLDRHRG